MSDPALQWVTGGDTGVSSMAIWAHMMGSTPERGTFGNHPWDPSDFGRCYRLLKLVPEWRPRITEMAQYSAPWRRLSEAWGELEALYAEELPAGTAPKLYARMKELIDVKPASPTSAVEPPPSPEKQ